MVCELTSGGTRMSKPAVEESLWGTASGNVINVGQQPERSGCICLCL